MKRASIAAAFCLLLLAGTATAAGGGSIAAAPQLPIGQNVVGGGSCQPGETPPTCTATTYGDAGFAYAEYWHILAQPSDRLTIDFGSNDGNRTSVDLYAPSVTDNNVVAENPVVGSDTETKNQLQYTFPSGGSWTVEITGDGGTLSYQLTAYIKHFTHVAISAPRLAKHDSNVIYVGSVSGTSGGKIELESRDLSQSSWRPFAVVTLRANGSFTYKTKVAASGTYRIKALYPGDNSHLSSSATVSFRVV